MQTRKFHSLYRFYVSWWKWQEPVCVNWFAPAFPMYCIFTQSQPPQILPGLINLPVFTNISNLHILLTVFCSPRQKKPIFHIHSGQGAKWTVHVIILIRCGPQTIFLSTLLYPSDMVWFLIDIFCRGGILLLPLLLLLPIATRSLPQ